MLFVRLVTIIQISCVLHVSLSLCFSCRNLFPLVSSEFADFINQMGASVASNASTPEERAKYPEERGNFCFHIGQEKKALDFYKESLALDNDNAFVHQQVALLYRKTRDGDRALLHFREAVRVEPSNALYHCNFGMFLSVCEGEDWVSDLAICELKTAVELKPDYTHALAELAIVLVQDKGDKEGARRYIGIAIEANKRLQTHSTEELLDIKRKILSAVTES